MIRDNFDIIKDLLVFENEADYYLVVLFKRKKDQIDNKFSYRINSVEWNYNISIKDFYIFKKEDLDKYKDEIIALSELYNARAYIFLQRKNYKETYKYGLKYFSEILINEKWEGEVDIMHNASVDNYVDTKRRYLIDLDKEYFPLKDDLINFVLRYNDDYLVLPSVTGEHIICDNINEFEFTSKYPAIFLHTNKPSILYYNTKRDE
jgi:hypothetical protein